MTKSSHASTHHTATKQPWWLKALDVLAATLFCFAVIWIFHVTVGKWIHKAEKLNPLANQIEDFEISDYLFAYTHKPVMPDTSIVIINCSKDRRDTIAKKIGEVEQAGVRAIGLDILFEQEEQDPDKIPGSAALIDTLNRYKSNIIFASALHDGASTLDKEFYGEMFNKNNGEGSYHIGVLEPENIYQTKRSFKPFFKTGSATDTAFAVMLARVAFGEKSVAPLIERHHERELINYRRSFEGAERFPIYEKVPPASVLKGKIVIFGAADSNLLTDRYFTPLNGSLGRAYPDMHGCIYQAHALSMILRGDYINEPAWKGLWVFLTCFLFMFLFFRLFHYHSYYHFLLDGIILVIAVLFLVLSHYLLEWRNIKLEPKNFIGPIFICGILLHLYEPARQFILKLFKRQ